MSRHPSGRDAGQALETRTYTNPVYPGYFADPFVWRHEGVYYAIGTGAHEAGGEPERLPGAGGEAGPKVFPLLRSADFVSWQQAGNALVRPESSLGNTFWAPEVAWSDEVFYLYYSVGHEDKNHQLRVATSTRPEGPYRDQGRALIDPAVSAFVIDPHPFRDDDGRWYLFYARDFLDTDADARAGTALAVRPLIDMTHLGDDETVVLRARFDWQRFLVDRPMYGSVYDWHTLEGPCVRRHDGRYYCFYSGGRWETDSYGVDYAEAERVLGPYQHPATLDHARVLRTERGRVLGPGHNSIVVGPDDETEFIAYHAWDPERTARRLFLDRLLWTSDGPRCAGPTLDPQRIRALSHET